MKFEVGKTYTNRRGEKLLVIYTDAPGDQPIVAVHDADGVSQYCANGSFYEDESDCGSDLVSEYVEPPKPREVWVRIIGDYVGHAFTEQEVPRLNEREQLVKFREVIE